MSLCNIGWCLEEGPVGRTVVLRYHRLIALATYCCDSSRSPLTLHSVHPFFNKKLASFSTGGKQKVSIRQVAN